MAEGDEKQTVLDYESAGGKYPFTTIDYVTAVANAIPAFLIASLVTSFTLSIFTGGEPIRGVFENVVDFMGLYGPPLGIALLCYRNVLRGIRRRKSRRRR